MQSVGWPVEMFVVPLDILQIQSPEWLTLLKELREGQPPLQRYQGPAWHLSFWKQCWPKFLPHDCSCSPINHITNQSSDFLALSNCNIYSSTLCRPIYPARLSSPTLDRTYCSDTIYMSCPQSDLMGPATLSYHHRSSYNQYEANIKTCQ